MIISLISAILSILLLFLIFQVYYKTDNVIVMWIMVGFSFYGMATIIREAINITLR